VGAHAIIGAGAVVVGEVPEYAIAVGIPARVTRDRRDAAPDTVASPPEEPQAS
jgi:acetyltransferase-like isoleucine patch superfamily enzyme